MLETYLQPKERKTKMFNDIVTFVQEHWDEIFTAITSLVGFFTILARFTPTTVDDNIVAGILKAINFLALNIKPAAKKEAAVEMIQAGVVDSKEVGDAVTGVSTQSIINKAAK